MTGGMLLLHVDVEIGRRRGSRCTFPDFDPDLCWYKYHFRSGIDDDQQH